MVLEHVLASDRGGCHKNVRTAQWGKMNAGYLEECKYHLPSLRNKIFETFNLINTSQTYASAVSPADGRTVDEKNRETKHVGSAYSQICGKFSSGDNRDELVTRLLKIPIPLLFIDRGEVNTLPPWNISDTNITEADILERNRIEEEGKTKVQRRKTFEFVDRCKIDIPKIIEVERKGGRERGRSVGGGLRLSSINFII